jgi:hypothetical protein
MSSSSWPWSCVTQPCSNANSAENVARVRLFLCLHFSERLLFWIHPWMNGTSISCKNSPMIHMDKTSANVSTCIIHMPLSLCNVNYIWTYFTIKHYYQNTQEIYWLIKQILTFRFKFILLFHAYLIYQTKDVCPWSNCLVVDLYIG